MQSRRFFEGWVILMTDARIPIREGDVILLDGNVYGEIDEIFEDGDIRCEYPVGDGRAAYTTTSYKAFHERIESADTVEIRSNA